MKVDMYMYYKMRICIYCLLFLFYREGWCWIYDGGCPVLVVIGQGPPASQQTRAGTRDPLQCQRTATQVNQPYIYTSEELIFIR